jgi:hypothetical protein
MMDVVMGDVTSRVMADVMRVGVGYPSRTMMRPRRGRRD